MIDDLIIYLIKEATWRTWVKILVGILISILMAVYGPSFIRDNIYIDSSNKNVYKLKESTAYIEYQKTSISVLSNGLIQAIETSHIIHEENERQEFLTRNIPTNVIDNGINQTDELINWKLSYETNTPEIICNDAPKALHKSIIYAQIPTSLSVPSTLFENKPAYSLALCVDNIVRINEASGDVYFVWPHTWSPHMQVNSSETIIILPSGTNKESVRVGLIKKPNKSNRHENYPEGVFEVSVQKIGEKVEILIIQKHPISSDEASLFAVYWK